MFNLMSDWLVRASNGNTSATQILHISSVLLPSGRSAFAHTRLDSVIIRIITEQYNFVKSFTRRPIMTKCDCRTQRQHSEREGYVGINTHATTDPDSDHPS